MSDYGRISKSIVKAIADALRFCNGNEAQYTPAQMPNAVRLLKKRLTQKTITRNGVYIPPSNYDGFDRVTVNVEGGDTVLVEKNITANGTYDPADDLAGGYNSVTVNVPPTVPNLQSKSATQNGQVTPDSGYDGLSSVEVAVPNTYSAADNGKVVSGGQLVAQTARAEAITGNGTFDTTENNSVTVNVPPTVPNLQSKSATQNGTVTPDTGYDGLSQVSVNVPNTYSAADNGKVVSNGQLVAQTARAEAIAENGTFDTTENNSVTVNVPNSYRYQDEGKVVSNGALVAQTARAVTANGTYDTTNNNSVVVNVDASGAFANYDKWELLNSGNNNSIIVVYTIPQTDWDAVGYSASVLNIYRSQTVYLVKKAFSTLDNMQVQSGWLLTQAGNDSHIHEKALTEIHIDGEECQLLIQCFEGFYNLENVYLNTSAEIFQEAFADILDNQSRPSNLPLRIYMHGNTLGTCNGFAFGMNWQSTGSGGGSESESSSNGCSGEISPYNIPNLEIYVPAALLNDFKTTWASGMFANNIYPLPNE